MGATKTQQIVNQDDKDLVQLAGYYAYKPQKREEVLEVNQRMFRVRTCREKFILYGSYYCLKYNGYK